MLHVKVKMEIFESTKGLSKLFSYVLMGKRVDIGKLMLVIVVFGGYVEPLTQCIGDVYVCTY